MNEDIEYLFVVDTEQYSGNFEREMGAYLTGVVREYFSDTAEQLAERYKQETGEDDESSLAGILGIHRGDGEHSPLYVAVWPTPGWWTHNGKEFRDEDFDREQAKRKKPLNRFMAVLSVAILFTERPTDEQIERLNQRARAFPKALEEVTEAHLRRAQKVTVTGTRLTESRTTHREVYAWKA